MSLTKELLTQRYPAADSNLDVASNPTLDLLLSHRTVRGLLSKPLPPETIPTLVAAAQAAATWGNLQPWSVVAVEDPERKARLAAISNNQPHITQAPLLLVWLADLSRLRRIAEAKGADPRKLSDLDYFVIAVTDAALAAQNAVVAAEALGLGTVYIGALRRDVKAVARELELPPEVLPVFGLTVGYPDPSKPASIKPRLSQRTILHRETYSTAFEREAVAAYDLTLGETVLRAGQTPAFWSQQKADQLKERPGEPSTLKAVLEELGFGLR